MTGLAADSPTMLSTRCAIFGRTYSLHSEAGRGDKSPPLRFGAVICFAAIVCATLWSNSVELPALPPKSASVQKWPCRWRGAPRTWWNW